MITPAQPTNSQFLGLSTHRGLFWREWALLAFAGTLSAMALLPATWALVQRTALQWRVSLPIFLALQLLQSAIQVGILVAIGLFFARRTGLRAPILEGYLVGDGQPRSIRNTLMAAIGLGAAAAVVIIALDRLVFAQWLPGLSTLITQIGGWQGLLAAFEGGILEELEMRLFLLSALAWLFSKVSHTENGMPTRGALWLATLISAALFGLGHLPATALSIAITPLVVVRALVLNGIVGMLSGYFYWKRGLEFAMLSHFTADVVLHFVWPFIR